MDAIAAATPGRPLLGLRAILPISIAMVSLAFLVTYLFGPRPLLAIVSAGTSVDRQVVWGVVIGLVVAIPAWIAIRNIRVFAGFCDQMRALALRMDLGGFNPLWFGLCAGAGEEALCRGALQPLIGVWLTSLLFTLAHYRTGSFRSMGPSQFGYAVFVFVASVLMGYVLIELGLIAAAVAHATVDVVGIVLLRSDIRRHQECITRTTGS